MAVILHIYIQNHAVIQNIKYNNDNNNNFIQPSKEENNTYIQLFQL